MSDLYPVEWMGSFFVGMPTEQVCDIAHGFAVALAERTLVGWEFKADAAHWLRAADAELRLRADARRNVRAVGDEG